MNRRLAGFILIAVVLVAGAGAYLLVAAGRQPARSGDLASQAAAAPLPGGPFIAFRQTTVDDAYGVVATVPLQDPAAAAKSTGLSCERIHLSRSGGICLAVDRGIGTTAKVLLLGSDLSVRHTLSTPGIPSRARVSADGRWAATTTFVYGHSYAATGFSTQTEIYDMATGESTGSVENFAITDRGQPYTAVDINVWGITFAPDSDNFYATVKTRGEIHLAKGNVPDRTLELLDIVAECPSLSPSGHQLAYKSATSPGKWQIRVRTLADGDEKVIAESNSVDDQIEWLDEDHVVYGLDRAQGAGPDALTDVWVAPADGSAPSQVLIPGAWSPAVVR